MPVMLMLLFEDDEGDKRNVPVPYAVINGICNLFVVIIQDYSSSGKCD
jgi:hypothetical protein